MLTIIVPLLFMVLGALVYALSANPKMQELGRLLFMAGSFALAFYFSGRSISL